MFKIRFFLISLFIILFLSQTNLIFVTDNNVDNQNIILASSFNVDFFNASVFYAKQCGFCHTKEELIGPDMNKIKAVYLKKYSNKNAFVKAVSSFVANPDKKNVIYKEGIDNFMDMPKMPFKSEEIKAVAAYIYDAATFK